MATVYASKGTYPGPFPYSRYWSSSSTNPQVKVKEQVVYGRKQQKRQKRQKHRIFRCPSRCQLTAHLQDFTHHSSGALGEGKVPKLAAASPLFFHLSTNIRVSLIVFSEFAQRYLRYCPHLTVLSEQLQVLPRFSGT